MNILTFDCSSKSLAGSVGTSDKLIATRFSDENRNHAPYLMPMIDDMLKEADWVPDNLDLIGVTIGPGSFTGLRIGLSTAKAFCDFTGVPLAPLNSMDVLAENKRDYCGIIVTMLDARKNQVYAAIYDNRLGNLRKIQREIPIHPLEELNELLLSHDHIYFIGDAVPVWQDKLLEFYGERAVLGRGTENGIQGEALYRCAVAMAKENYTDSSVMPLYLRGVDAKAKFARFNFRPMHRGDIPALLALEKTAFPKPWTEGMFVSELKNEQARYWVLEYEGKLTAYAGFWLVCGEAHITNIAVHGDFRNMGQGTAMFDYLLKMALLYGAHSVTLEVRPSNDAALNLYRSRGFKIEGKRTNYYEDNGEDAYIMWLRFPDTDNEKPWREQ